MSVLQYNLVGGQPIVQRITNSTVAVVVDATNNVVFVPWFEVNQIVDAALNLTVEIYDGTNSVYLGANGSTWNAKAISGKAHLRFDAGYVIPILSKLRVTSSDGSGNVHVVGIISNAP